MPGQPQNPQEHLVALISRHQSALYGYILGLLPNPAKADDVLQETNLILWRKAGDFDQTQPFMPWARRIAYFQVKAALRDAARDRHVFDSELLDLLAAEDEIDSESSRALDLALQSCLAELPDDKRELILNRYQVDSSVNEMAAARNIASGALSAQLHRIRQALERCIEGKLNQQPA